MVKDFDAHGFTVSEELMTNADVPSFALGGIVENPKNPFSGKPINMEPKNNQPLHILSSDRFDTMTYNGNTFDCGLWLTVEKEVHDKNNWTILRDERWQLLQNKKYLVDYSTRYTLSDTLLVRQEAD